MDSGLVRLIIVAALFLLLAGDYSSLLDRLGFAFKVDAEPRAQAKPDAKVEDTTAQLALKETGSLSINNETQFTTNVYITKTKRRVLVFLKSEGEKKGRLKTALGRFAKAQLLATMKNFCLPKLICELNAMPQKDKLSDSEKSLLSLISDTTISTTAEVTSKYHFAAHMGQLISGVDGAGCHNFYPSCPFPGVQVLNMIKNIRLRPPS